MNPSEHGPHFPSIRTLDPLTFEVPPEFSRLSQLAYNLWWSWAPEARALFSRIDAELWDRFRNPLQVLRHAEERHWAPLLKSESFQANYREVIGAFDRYMSEPSHWWWNETHGDVAKMRVAYLSTEYGLHETLSIYSGGLGVLSGDHLKSASDLGVPLVGVGLFYRYGYFRQAIDADGRQQHGYPPVNEDNIPVRPVIGSDGRPLVVSVPIGDREVHLSVLLVQVGRVVLLLLDSDTPLNDDSLRPITNILYVRGREMRMCQEMVLGVGAVRVLRALGIAPDVWHVNEGHSALMALERIREEMAHGADFEEAKKRVSESVVFTTHTPVPAGNETFEPAVAEKLLAPWTAKMGVDLHTLTGLGRVSPDNREEHFNLTVLAMRTSSFRNGVSKKHGDVSRAMWRDLFHVERPPVESITNGVHVDSWIGLEIRNLLSRQIGSDWRETARSKDEWHAAVESIPDREVWDAHMAQKQRLIRLSRSMLRHTYARHGSAPDELDRVDGLLDPGALAIGFARRFATYKRAGLLFHDLDRARSILCNAERPVQVIFAGKAHPADREGQALVEKLFQLQHSEGLQGRVVFLEGYDMRLGRLLVQGCEVWLNTPRMPLEASGTSGQKASINGGLNLSVPDGWWIEGYSPDVGWCIGSEGESTESQPDDEQMKRQNEADAAALYDVLEQQVTPLYFDRGEDGIPTEWIRRMKCAIRDLLPQFSGERMVREYVDRAYVPAAAAKDRSPA